MKLVAQWLRGQAYRDEPITPRPGAGREPAPAMIRAIRSLQRGIPAYRQSREQIFVKQATVLAEYEDDYPFDREVVRYYPTYQSFSDQELRGYFSWRTRLRQGRVEKTCLSFAYLYIYELLNQIGCSDPEDGYRKLTAFQTAYGELDDGVSAWLRRWLWDYVIYYGLDPALLADRPEVRRDRALAVLRRLNEAGEGEIAAAAVVLSSYRMDNSRYYREHGSLVDRAMVRIFRRLETYYAKHRKKTWLEDYFGSEVRTPVLLFESAVFLDRRRDRSADYAVDELRVYRVRDGRWTAEYVEAPKTHKLGDLLRTVDATLRELSGYPHPVKPGTEVKWLLALVREECAAVLEEEKQAEARRVTIDFSRLGRIRAEAAQTRDRLIVDEEEPPTAPPVELPPQPEPPAPEPSASAAPDPWGLSPEETRFLRDLLCGGDLGWLRERGLLASVLADSVNDKLFEEFADTVLVPGEPPRVVEDYAAQLKEMIAP